MKHSCPALMILELPQSMSVLHTSCVVQVGRSPGRGMMTVCWIS